MCSDTRHRVEAKVTDGSVGLNGEVTASVRGTDATVAGTPSLLRRVSAPSRATAGPGGESERVSPAVSDEPVSCAWR